MDNYQQKPVIDVNHDPIELVEKSGHMKAYSMAVIPRVGLPPTPYVYLVPYWSFDDSKLNENAFVKVQNINDLIRKVGFTLSIRGAHQIELCGKQMPYAHGYPYAHDLDNITQDDIIRLTEEARKQYEYCDSFKPGLLISSYKVPLKGGGIIKDDEKTTIEAIYGDAAGILRFNLPYDTYEVKKNKFMKTIREKTFRVVFRKNEIVKEKINARHFRSPVLDDFEIATIYNYFNNAIKQDKRIYGSHWVINEIGLFFFRLDLK